MSEPPRRRARRVAEVAERIRRGSYRVPAIAVADAILARMGSGGPVRGR